MGIQIGAKPESGFDDPIGMMSDCHRRVENFLRVLALVADQTRGGPLNPEQRRALESALRYFREAAPKHTADEETSLFPRLRQIDTDEVRLALARVDALEADHRTAAPDHDTVDRIGEKWLAEESLAPLDFSEYFRAVQRLHSIYAEHIKIEDNEVFPLAKRVLPKPDQLEVGREMAARRGVEQTNI